MTINKIPTSLRDVSCGSHINTVLSMDYEVFFGRNTGTVEKSLLEPSQALSDFAERQSVPLVFFVDVGFLLRLREEGRRVPSLMRDHDRIMRQLEHFVAAGHELQLHVHPHWEDSHWNGKSWDIDTRRYRLHDFGELEIHELVQRYAKALRAVAGDDEVFAYRAGGWMIQPFAQIREALLKAGIYIDSTVITGGRSEWGTHGFDFTDAPMASHWFFDNDPMLIDPEGAFLEIPIASYRLSPAFYWRFALMKKLGWAMHQPLSDGSPIPLSFITLVEKLSHWTISEVSMDGYKASFLADAFRSYKLAGKTDFVVIGHPKALTRYSLQQLKLFVAECKATEIVGYGAYRRATSHMERKSKGG